MAGNGGLLLRGDTWHMRFQVKGVLIAESTHTSNRRDAERILAKRKAELIENLVLAGVRPIHLHKAIDEFLKTREGTAGHKNAKMHFDRFKKIPDKQLNRVAAHELNSIVEGMKAEKYKLSTIQVAVNYFNAFVKWAKAQSYTACARMDTIKGVKGKIRWLTLDEQTKLLASVHPDTAAPTTAEETKLQKQDNWDLLACLLDTGARYNEIAKLQWQQVSFSEGKLHIRRQKGGRDTMIKMTRRLREVLERRKSIDAHWVFPTKKDANNNTHWMQRAVKAAGLSTAQGSINLHTMRHTAAATWLQAGLPLSEVAHMLGHSSVAITAKYAHFIPDDAATKAAAILDNLQASLTPKAVPAELRLAA